MGRFGLRLLVYGVIGLVARPVFALQSTLFAVADARTISPNFGFNDSQLIVGSTAEFFTPDHALVRFDLSSIPANAIITKAHMDLFLVQALGAPTLSILYTPFC